MVSFTQEENCICSQKQLNDIAYEHTIICRQLFAGHVVGSWPMKRKKHLHRMIIRLIAHTVSASRLHRAMFMTQNRIEFSVAGTIPIPGSFCLHILKNGDFGAISAKKRIKLRRGESHN